MVFTSFKARFHHLSNGCFSGCQTHARFMQGCMFLSHFHNAAMSITAKLCAVLRHGILEKEGLLFMKCPSLLRG